jgi:hypothetical protein
MSPKAYTVMLGFLLVIWVGAIVSFSLVSTQGSAEDQTTGNDKLLGLVMGWSSPLVVVLFVCIFFYYRANASMMLQILFAMLVLVMLPTSLSLMGLAATQLGGVRDVIAAAGQQ